jgi:hypothetical protein
MNEHKSIRRIQIFTNSKTEGVANRNLSSVICLLSSALFSFSGCADSLRKPALSDISINVKKYEAMETTEDVLARMYFKIDKFDPDAGYIKTRPLEGAQFFEFWRSDNVGAQNFALGNLHSIRRTVEIWFSENSETPQALSGTSIDCVVHIQRLSMPEQQVTSSARAYAMFSRSSPALQTLRPNPEQQKDMAWIELGRDRELEREIIQRISSILDTNHSLLAVENGKSNTE